MKELAPGTTIGAYQVERWLDRGGVASVYLGRHVRLGAAYVLKLVHRPSPGLLPRLLREGQLQSRLQHPNVLSVFDLLQWQDNPVLVLEYVDGPNLDELLRLRRLELDQVDELVTGILRGVSAAHRFGLVHRDLKPSNILLARHDHALIPKIADFGLAKVLDTDQGEVRTRTGQVFGTPSYMSPEQFVDAASVDVRSDIFALGCIFYEMVSGKRAYDGADLFVVNRKVQDGDRIPLRQLREDVPDRMVRAIDRCLQVHRSERFDSCEELLAAWRTGSAEDAPVWLRPANSVARLTISKEELDALRERRRRVPVESEKSAAPLPVLGSGEGHPPTERLGLPVLAEEDAKHLAGCVPCRVARLQIQRAEEDPAPPAPPPEPEAPPPSPVPEAAEPEPTRVDPEVTTAKLPRPSPRPRRPPRPPAPPPVPEEESRSGWIAMAVLLPLAAAVGFFSVLGLAFTWLTLAKQGPVAAGTPTARAESIELPAIECPRCEPTVCPPPEPAGPTAADGAPPTWGPPPVARRSVAPPEVIPEVPPPEPAPPPTASWSWTGDARVVRLQHKNGEIYREGQELPAGRYRALVSFRRHGEVEDDAWFKLGGGDHLALECLESFAKCQWTVARGADQPSSRNNEGP